MTQSMTNSRMNLDEPLEPRRLLAFTHFTDDGTLILDGTSGKDQIVISFQHTGVALILNDQIESFDELPPHLRVRGNGGNDVIDARVSPVTVFIDGGAGDDSINGSVFADTLYGGDGRDTIIGDGGKDMIRGGAGNDRLLGDGGANPDLVAADTLFGDAGDDFIDGNEGNDVAHGGAGNDSILGSAGTDQVMGDDGNDTLTGGAGADRLYGGAGNDIFHTRDNVRDTIDAGAGSNNTKDIDKTDVLLHR